MPLKPIKVIDTWGIGIFDSEGGFIQPSHHFSGTNYATEEKAQKAIERHLLNKKLGW